MIELSSRVVRSFVADPGPCNAPGNVTDRCYRPPALVLATATGQIHVTGRCYRPLALLLATATGQIHVTGLCYRPPALLLATATGLIHVTGRYYRPWLCCWPLERGWIHATGRCCRSLALLHCNIRGGLLSQILCGSFLAVFCELFYLDFECVQTHSCLSKRI